jgi:hypothetical protein
MPLVPYVGRAPSPGRLERLEPDIGKPIRPVLRGGGGGNVVSLLDAMRLTVLQQTAKGLPQTISVEEETYRLRDAVVRELERLKWFLWHGNVYRAFQVMESVERDLDVAPATGDGTARKLLKAVQEFHTYIDRNRAFIPNYGERYRYGERISTGFVESTVNQVIGKRFCKKQQIMDQAGCAFAVTNPGENSESGTRSGFPTMVSGSAAGGRAPDGVTPQLFDGLLTALPSPATLALMRLSVWVMASLPHAACDKEPVDADLQPFPSDTLRHPCPWHPHGAALRRCAVRGEHRTDRGARSRLPSRCRGTPALTILVSPA